MAVPQDLGRMLRTAVTSSEDYLNAAECFFAMDNDIPAVDSPQDFPSSTPTCPLTAPQGVLWSELTSALNPEESMPCPQPPYHKFSGCMELDFNYQHHSSNPFYYVKDEQGMEIPDDDDESAALSFNIQNIPPAPPREAQAATLMVRRLTKEERREKVERYLMKKSRRNFRKKIKYACRKTLADIRPRVRGRFAKSQTKADCFEPCRSTVTQDTAENMIGEEPCVSICSFPDICRNYDVRNSLHAYVEQY